MSSDGLSNTKDTSEKRPVVNILGGLRFSLIVKEQEGPAGTAMNQTRTSLTPLMKVARLARCGTGSYTGGPAKWQVWRWGSPLSLTFLGLRIRASKSITNGVV
jgi:hypothetical protein